MEEAEIIDGAKLYDGRLYVCPPFGEFNKEESYRSLEENESRFKAIRNSIGSIPGKNILDVGCATGYMGFRLLQCGADYILGLDNKPSQLKLIDHFAKRYDLKFHTWCVNIPVILSPTVKHDVVLYLDLHQHIIQYHGLDAAMDFLRMLKKISKTCFISPSGQNNNGKMEIDLIEANFKFECVYEGKAPYGRNIYKCW